jgi:hypothetical protein
MRMFAIEGLLELISPRPVLLYRRLKNLKGPYMEPSPICKHLTVYYGGGKWPSGFTKTKCPPLFS